MLIGLKLMQLLEQLLGQVTEYYLYMKQRRGRHRGFRLGQNMGSCLSVKEPSMIRLMALDHQKIQFQHRFKGTLHDSQSDNSSWILKGNNQVKSLFYLLSVGPFLWPIRACHTKILMVGNAL
jgi:hypothetical protein